MIDQHLFKLDGAGAIVRRLAVLEVLQAFLIIGQALSLSMVLTILWQGKKLGGILCEAAQGAILCGIGINLMQDEAYFAQNGLVHGVSAAQILGRMPGADTPERLAQTMSEIFAEGLEDFYRQGFAAVREEYLSRCANLGRRVQFDGGEGRAVDVDETGCLVVDNGKGKQAVFTGEVTVQGIYGVK